MEACQAPLPHTPPEGCSAGFPGLCAPKDPALLIRLKDGNPFNHQRRSTCIVSPIRMALKIYGDTTQCLIFANWLRIRCCDNRVLESAQSIDLKPRLPG
jgi:hypothetical protein